MAEAFGAMKSSSKLLDKDLFTVDLIHRAIVVFFWDLIFICIRVIGCCLGWFW
jgi:hypothetical protein